jgi:hypothetical protein
MPDFAMDYEELYAMQRGMHTLADQAGDGGGSGKFAELGNRSASENTAIFGSSDLAIAFGVFFRMSKSRTEKATEKLRQFGDTFEGVAQALFQQDAQIASGAVAAAARAEFNRWRAAVERHENWEQATATWNDYLESIGADGYFRDHPGAQMGEVCAQDDRPGFCDRWEQDLDAGTAPQQPGPEPPVPSENPPSRMRFTGPDGSTTEIALSYNEDHQVVSESTTTTLPDGETFTQVTDYTYGDNGDVVTETVKVKLPDGGEMTSVTTYEGTRNEALNFDDRDYTTTTTGPDGSTTVEKVTINDDGSGTKVTTVTEVGEDGNEEVTTTTQTRTGPRAPWEDPAA